MKRWGNGRTYANLDEDRPIKWGKEVVPQQHNAGIANHGGNYPTGTQNPWVPSLGEDDLVLSANTINHKPCEPQLVVRMM